MLFHLRFKCDGLKMKDSFIVLFTMMTRFVAPKSK